MHILRYYFTSFVTDTATKEPLTLFWTLNAQGYVDKIKLPFLSTLFRLGAELLSCWGPRWC
jgi:hypothetical protein